MESCQPIKRLKDKKEEDDLNKGCMFLQGVRSQPFQYPKYQDVSVFPASQVGATAMSLLLITGN
jgi:hypothetical protein